MLVVPRRKPKSTEMTCSVCGDKAPDHIHYGGIACFSCRAFFRRSVPKNSSYFCSTNQSCIITVTTRKNCQFCRYKKCLLSGMKPSWVLSEEEKNSRNLIKYNTCPSSGSSSGSSSPGPILPDHSRLTPDEARHIDNLIFAQDSTRHFIPMPENVMREILEMTQNPGQNMTSEGVTDLYRVVYSRVAKFATYIEQFEGLLPSDKKLLLSKNMDSMAVLRSSVCFNKDGTGNLSCQLRNTGSPVYGSVGGHYVGVERVFRHPWARSEAHRGLFKETFGRICKVGLGEKEAMLLQLVTLFSVMDLPVKERKRIEGYQEEMAMLCYRYLRSKSMHSNDVIKVFMILSELRYLSNLLTSE